MTPDKVEEIYWSIHTHSDDGVMENRHKAVIARLTQYHQDMMQETIHEWNKARFKMNGTAQGAINCIEHFDNYLISYKKDQLTK